jgi:hypothetical protein
MLGHIKRRPSPAMAVAFVALLAALSGSAIALPGKNTVDSGDIKKNAVKSADIGKNQVKNTDIANNAVTGKKVKSNSLLGADVRESSLGLVPTANRANSAGSADVANRLAAPEAYREIGTPGNPGFGAGCHNLVPVAPNPDVFEKAAFFKDHNGIVHLRGTIECDPTGANPNNNIAWQMPPGYRPRNGRLQVFANAICGGTCSSSTPPGSPIFFIAGAGVPPVGPTVVPEGGLLTGDGNTSFDGISYRAEG